MKEKYIKQVKRLLMVSGSKKQEILRDLSEIFQSAQEHGDTQEQVIKRLGTPEEFVEDIHERMGIHGEEKKRRKIGFIIGSMVLVAAMALTIGIGSRCMRTPDNVIGQGNVMTSIQVQGPGIDISILFMAAGCVLLAAAAVLIFGYRRILHKRKKDL